MRKHYLVLSRDDFGRPITLSFTTDLMDCEAEADYEASKDVSEYGSPVYVFELKRVYATRPKEPTKEVETVYVD